MIFKLTNFLCANSIRVLSPKLEALYIIFSEIQGLPRANGQTDGQMEKLTLYPIGIEKYLACPWTNQRAILPFI